MIYAKVIQEYVENWRFNYRYVVCDRVSMNKMYCPIEGEKFLKCE